VSIFLIVANIYPIYLHMYIYIMYINLHMYIYTRVNLYTFICKKICIYICIYLYVNMYIYIYIYELKLCLYVYM